MSGNVSGIHGNGDEFNPDNVLGDTDVESSAFDAGERPSGSAATKPASAPRPLLKYGLIAIAGVLFAFMAYYTVAPLLPTKATPAVTHAPVILGSAQVPPAQGQAQRQSSGEMTPNLAPGASTIAAQTNPGFNTAPVAPAPPSVTSLTSPQMSQMVPMLTANAATTTNGGAIAAPQQVSDAGDQSRMGVVAFASSPVTDALALRISGLEGQLAKMQSSIDSLTLAVEAKSGTAARAVKAAADSGTAVPSRSVSKTERQTPTSSPTEMAQRRMEKANGLSHKGAKASDEPSKKSDDKASPGLALKAVLEGRAWLQRPGGETLTVAPGDSVPGLGQVQSIDASEGTVRFSSGTVLR